MGNYAVLDFSIGSISLLVISSDRKRHEIIYKTHSQCLLSEYIDENRVLCSKGIDIMIQKAKELLESARRMDVGTLFSISTTLLRNIENRNEVLSRIKDETGLEPENLSGSDEAYAVYCANERYRILPKAILIHMGSASTELCSYERARKDSMFNLEFGAESLSRLYSDGLCIKEENLEKIAELTSSSLEVNEEKLGRKKFENAVVAGSNAKAIYTVYRAYWDIDKDNEAIMQRKKLSKLLKALMKKKKRSRLLLESIPEKAYLAIPAIESLLTILRRYKINNVTVSYLGVKEGWFRIMMKDRRNESKD